VDHRQPRAHADRTAHPNIAGGNYVRPEAGKVRNFSILEPARDVLCSAFILPEAAPSEGYQSGLVRVPPIPSRAHERILVVQPAECCFGMHEAKIGESMPRLRQRHR